MDHKEAVRQHAAERYVLGELTGAQREEYEEHYFDCAECALDVRTAAAFVNMGREALRTEGMAEKTVKPAGGWFLWLRPAFAVPTLAALLLLVVVGYQNFVSVPHWKNAAMQGSSPRVLPMYSLIAANTRSGPAQTFRVRAGEAFGLYVDIPADPAYTKYALRLTDPDGGTAILRTVSSAEAQKTVVVEVMPGKSGGTYQMVVLGLTEQVTDVTRATTLESLKFSIELVN